MANDVFDEQFKNRLMAFQRDHGLTLDGTLGPQAWTKLAEVATSKPEPTAAPEETQTKLESTQQPVVVASASGTSFAITAEKYPLLVKLATLCVDEAGTAQFIREELDVDLDEINATIEEVLA
jgi:hypothetical protein